MFKKLVSVVTWKGSLVLHIVSPPVLMVIYMCVIGQTNEFRYSKCCTFLLLMLIYVKNLILYIIIIISTNFFCYTINKLYSCVSVTYVHAMYNYIALRPILLYTTFYSALYVRKSVLTKLWCTENGKLLRELITDKLPPALTDGRIRI